MKDMKEYTRVTTALKPFSGLDKIDKHILDKAAERGKKVHKICDAIMEGIGFYDNDLEVNGYINSFEQWRKEKTFLTKPERFFDDEYMITGEIDCLYLSKKGIVLVDFKTSGKEGKTWKLQGSAYSYMAKKHGHKIAAIEFVKLDKKGGEPKSFFYEEDFGLFLECLHVYRYFFKNEEQEDVLEYL